MLFCSFPELFLWAEKFPFVSSEPGMLSPAFKHEIFYFLVSNCASYFWKQIQKGLNKLYSKNLFFAALYSGGNETPIV